MASAETHARISPEMIERLRSLIGVERIRRNAWTTRATFDAIRHWTWALGDDNPFFLQRDYLEPERKLIAPPTLLYSMCHGPMGPGAQPARGKGMPGIHGLHTGDYWEFLEPLREDDAVEATTRLVEVDERAGRYSKTQVWRTSETRFVRDDGKLVATMKHVSVSTERGDSVKGSGKFEGIERWTYTDEEISQILEDYAAEKRRGNVPRYWDEVAVGDDLGHVIKGPLTIQSMISFWSAWGCLFGMSDKVWYDFVAEHPRAPFKDPGTNVLDVPDAGHYDERFARELGFPTGYDIGVQRISWFGHLMTNWGGDDSRLTALGVDLRRPNWLGDTTWIKGRVISKREHNGEHVVDCEMWAENQRGDRHATGTASVALPKRPSE